jgi:hypothetical protein
VRMDRAGHGCPALPREQASFGVPTLHNQSSKGPLTLLSRAWSFAKNPAKRSSRTRVWTDSRGSRTVGA